MVHTFWPTAQGMTLMKATLGSSSGKRSQIKAYIKNKKRSYMDIFKVFFI
jgi:hypothetical protein